MLPYLSAFLSLLLPVFPWRLWSACVFPVRQVNMFISAARHHRAEASNMDKAHFSVAGAERGGAALFPSCFRRFLGSSAFGATSLRFFGYWVPFNAAVFFFATLTIACAGLLTTRDDVFLFHTSLVWHAYCMLACTIGETGWLRHWACGHSMQSRRAGPEGQIYREGLCHEIHSQLHQKGSNLFPVPNMSSLVYAGTFPSCVLQSETACAQGPSPLGPHCSAFPRMHAAAIDGSIPRHLQYFPSSQTATLNFLSSSSSSASSALPSSCPWVSSAPRSAAAAEVCLLAEGPASNESMQSQLDAFSHMANY